MRTPLVTSTDSLHPNWSGMADYGLRPTLMVVRDTSGFRPLDASAFNLTISSGNVVTGAQTVGITGSNGLSVNVVSVSGFNAIPVFLASGSFASAGGSTTTNGQVGVTGSNGLSVNVVSFNGFNAIPVVITSGQTIVSGASINLTGTQVVDSVIDYNFFAPLGFNGGVSPQDFPSFSILTSYFVPSGKSLKVDGYSIRTQNAGISLLSAVRDVMFAVSNVGPNGRPLAPILTPRTITGLTALSPSSTYSYKIVYCNHLGRTAAGPTGVITLAGSQNSVNVFITGAASTSADSYFEIYRSPANGASGTETFLASTTNATFSDVSPDSELLSDIPPSSDGTIGMVTGYAYPSGVSPKHVIIQGFSGSAGTVDIIYKNIYNKTRTVRQDYAANSATQVFDISETGVFIQQVSLRNRLPRLIAGHEWAEGGINRIVHVTTGAGGNFAIYGFTPIFYTQTVSGSQVISEYLPKTLTIPAGKEVVIAVAGANQPVATGKVDFIVYGRLV